MELHLHYPFCLKKGCNSSPPKQNLIQAKYQRLMQLSHQLSDELSYKLVAYCVIWPTSLNEVSFNPSFTVGYICLPSPLLLDLNGIDYKMTPRSKSTPMIKIILLKKQTLLLLFKVGILFVVEEDIEGMDTYIVLSAQARERIIRKRQGTSWSKDNWCLVQHVILNPFSFIICGYLGIKRTTINVTFFRTCHSSEDWAQSFI